MTIASATNFTFTDQNANKYNIIMKQDLLCLMIAYPEYITNIEENNGHVYLIMKSGKKLCYDDKKEKNSQEKLSNPDLQDTLDQIYPLSAVKSIMESNFDPGRFRSYDLLSEVYGTSKKAVESKLTKVKVGYSNFQFNNSSSASDSLQSVMSELIPLSERNQNVRRCLLPCSGTFNYRVIAGTNRLSPHSFGIAIDLASDKSDYWKWASKEAGENRLSSYPNELVKVFENNGFVWGGKWSHFDILHFEYRPEIILKARYFTGNVGSKNAWYEGAPWQQVPIKNAIDRINALIK
ncbi:M15 family metallopeptidase [Clostridium sp. CF011]|uniref:M15 family metallopeptidase n=1 Tax=Clostridium TaxID=1485 RepID=UPI0013EE4E41|nr:MULTISPECIES: M15 family metallopeptidase [Clostridium]MBU3091884.1 M15 family metallopeptidase [Clostridium sp. CF011]MBZ9608132.1 M15 family metallopeptidase [Clostridium estertheticum]WAG70401.1 M15 family metallopeptidase [Clostridium sp. CF011]